MTNKHWFVAGQGSVGSFIAYNALLSNVKCQQIIRDPYIKKTTNMWFHPISAESILLPLPISSAHLSKQSIHFLIVPLKAYDIIPFLQQIKPFLADDAAIVLCHNGLGTIDIVTNLMSPNMDLFFCTTSNGLYKNKQGVFQAGLGDSQWSHVAGCHPEKLINDDLIPLFNRINKVDNLQHILWQKLVINCVINPLSAIHKVKNGALSDQIYNENITSIASETLVVANAVGVSLDLDTTLAKVHQVINNTANNYSSMYQDIVSNKQSEIDFITGHIIKLGKELSIDTPISDDLYNKVKAL